VNPSGRTRTVALCVLGAAVCEIALAPGAFFRGETFCERDLARFMRPLKSLVLPLAQASDGLPLWNPLFASGQPFAANPHHALFHPLTLLFLVLPFELAFRLQVLVALAAAAGSMYFLLGSVGLGAPARALGALAWGFGGYALSTANLLPILLSIAALPAALAFAVRVFCGGGARDVGGLALALGLQLLAGEPSTLVATAVLLAATLAWIPRRDAAPRRLLLVGAGLVLAAALSAATWLPGLHLASKTVRSAGLSAADAGAWSLPPARLLELAAPRLLGHVESADERWYWGRALYPGRDYPLLYSLYPGLLVTLLALVAARDARRQAVWIATGIGGALLAAGTHTPVWSLARSLPGLSVQRYPEKFVLLTVFAVTVLGALGCEALVGGRPGTRRALGRLLAGVGVAAVAGGFAVLALDAARGPAAWVARGIHPAIASAWANVSAADAVRIACVAAALLAALVVVRKPAWPLVAVAVADVVLSGRALLPTKPAAELTAVPPFLAPLVRARPAGPLFHLAAWDPRLGTTSGIASPPIPVQWGIPLALEADFDLMELAWSHRATQEFLAVIREEPSLLGPLLARRGVSSVLRFRPGLAGRVGEELAGGSEGPLLLLQVRDSRPFAFCASRVVSAQGSEGWSEAVRRLGPEAATAAVVDPADVEALPEGVSGCSVSPAAVRPGSVAFEVNAPGPHPAFVAVNQTWDEGWHALVDGGPARVVRTDLSLSAVVLPPGRHRVVLTYRDPRVATGVAISLGALVLVAVLLVTRGRGGASAA
jgi:hypothetical protein